MRLRIGRGVPSEPGASDDLAVDYQGDRLVFDFDHCPPSLEGGAAGARNGSHRIQTATGSPRPAQIVFAGGGLPDRLGPTASDFPELHGMQKVRGSNPLSSTNSGPLFG